MNQAVIRICPICKSQNIDTIKEIFLDLPKEYNLPQKYSIVCCNYCGFCYANTSASLKEYEYYYENFNIYSMSPKDIMEYNSSCGRANFILKNMMSKDCSILDIGCGNGTLVRYLNKQNYKAIGMDPSERSVSLINSFYPQKAIKGSIYDIPEDKYKNSYDVIFLFSMLEHLLLPYEAICNLKTNYLTKMGKIFIEIPDYERININTTPLPNNFNQEHINYFSCQSLDNLMTSCGFNRIYNEKITYETNSIKEYGLFCGYELWDQDIKYTATIVKDANTLKSITEYLNNQSKVYMFKNLILSKICEKREPVMVWGTGALAMDLLANTPLKDCNITAFIDNNTTKIGTTFGNSKVIGPNDIPQDNSDTIIICSMLHSKNIIEQIKELGLSNSIIVLE